MDEERYFHVPGQDLILRRVEPKTGGLLGMDSVQAKLSADIARHAGRRRNSNECFGVCCLYIPHAFYYSVDGK